MNLKEQATIERRRRAEKERLARIFNVKYRTIGIDKISLDEQIKERVQMKQLEKQRDDAFDRETIRNNHNQIFLQEDELLRQRQNAQDLNQYRRLHQKPEDAREWDLNDRNRWKDLPPTRISDDDPRLGPSSGQIFTGEDLQASTRKKAQQEQLKSYFDTQIKTKIEKEEHERIARLLDDCKQRELTERSYMFERMEYECQRAMEIATRNYNEILTNETKIRANERTARETEAQLADLAHTTFSDLLTENVENILDSRCHIMVDRWKGMTKDQLDDIRHQQLIQIDEHQENITQQKAFDDAWGEYENTMAQQRSIINQQIEENNRLMHCTLANENQNLAKVQREHQNYLNSVLYRSAPTAAFYQQFNTTSR